MKKINIGILALILNALLILFLSVIKIEFIYNNPADDSFFIEKILPFMIYFIIMPIVLLIPIFSITSLFISTARNKIYSVVSMAIWLITLYFFVVTFFSGH